MSYAWYLWCRLGRQVTAWKSDFLLGFEALSRGAAYVVLVDDNKKVIAQLRETAQQLQAKQIEIKQEYFPQGFSSKRKFDIVFLDPPFYKNLCVPSVLFLHSLMRSIE